MKKIALLLMAFTLLACACVKEEPQMPTTRARDYVPDTCPPPAQPEFRISIDTAFIDTIHYSID